MAAVAALVVAETLDAAEEPEVVVDPGLAGQGPGCPGLAD